MHVLTETFIGVPIIVVQIFSRHIHASRHPPAQRSDGLKHNIVMVMVTVMVMVMMMVMVMVMVNAAQRMDGES